MQKLFEQFEPQYVYLAAAFKRLPMMDFFLQKLCVTMLLVGKMKELVPEYISSNSIYQQLDTTVISIAN